MFWMFYFSEENRCWVVYQENCRGDLLYEFYLEDKHQASELCAKLNSYEMRIIGLANELREYDER